METSIDWNWRERSHNLHGSFSAKMQSGSDPLFYIKTLQWNAPSEENTAVTIIFGGRNKVPIVDSPELKNQRGCCINSWKSSEVGGWQGNVPVQPSNSVPCTIQSEQLRPSSHTPRILRVVSLSSWQRSHARAEQDSRRLILSVSGITIYFVVKDN